MLGRGWGSALQNAEERKFELSGTGNTEQTQDLVCWRWLVVRVIGWEPAFRPSAVQGYANLRAAFSAVHSGYRNQDSELEK